MKYLLKAWQTLFCKILCASMQALHLRAVIGDIISHTRFLAIISIARLWNEMNLFPCALFNFDYLRDSINPHPSNKSPLD